MFWIANYHVLESVFQQENHRVSVFSSETVAIHQGINLNSKTEMNIISVQKEAYEQLGYTEKHANSIASVTSALRSPTKML